jgi:hypothetical protein
MLNAIGFERKFSYRQYAIIVRKWIFRWFTR